MPRSAARDADGARRGNCSGSKDRRGERAVSYGLEKEEGVWRTKRAAAGTPHPLCVVPFL